MVINDRWLPTGKHWGLNISRDITPVSTGKMQTACGVKTLLHTTEGTGFDGADETLIKNGAEPHFLIDPSTGKVKQYIALDRFARSLRHPAGTPATNAANVIQIEMVGFAVATPNWQELKYENVAALCCLIAHRTGVKRKAPHQFLGGKSVRFKPYAFLEAEGYVGHCHAPGNDHVDPGKFNIMKMFALMRELEKMGGAR